MSCAPIWRFFGADEPNYAYMKDGRKLLGRTRRAEAEGRFTSATHNLLTTGDGTPALKWGSTNAYTEDASGRPIYDWTIVDRIFDTYLERGVRPYVQIGFMPQALSRKPEPYQHEWRPGLPYEEIYTGWAYPPKDYAKWGELVYQWVKHCVERYGRAGGGDLVLGDLERGEHRLLAGQPEEFCKLHDYAIDAVRRALPDGARRRTGHGRLRPRSSCGLPRALPARHNFATGKRHAARLRRLSRQGRTASTWTATCAWASPTNSATIDEGFRIIASFPELKRKPIVIGESDPEGCAACQGPQLAYRNGTMYSSYTAASFARKHDLARQHGVNLEGALTWAFEFEDQPYFAGFRALATRRHRLPVLNVFRMF